MVEKYPSNCINGENYRLNCRGRDKSKPNTGIYSLKYGLELTLIFIIQ